MEIKHKIIMKALFLIVFLLIWVSSTLAQDLSPTVIATAGKDLSAGGYKLSFTIGELAVTTIKSTNNILTQGFQQPPNLYLSDIKSTSDYRINVNVYPNPTRDVVNISISEFNQNEAFSIYVYNNFGQLLMVPYENIQHSNGTNFTIDLTEYAKGNYFIRLVNDENSQIIADFKVLKVY